MSPEKINNEIILKAIEKVKAKFPDLDMFYLVADRGTDFEIICAMRAFTNYILDHQTNLTVLKDSVDLINELVEENSVGEMNNVIDVLELETFHVLCPYDQLANYFLNTLSPQAKLLFKDCYYMYNKHHLGYDI